MKRFLTIAFLLVILFSCTKNPLSGLNQIGTWEGIKVFHTYDEVSTISRDTFPIEIEFQDDGTGKIDNDIILTWEITNEIISFESENFDNGNPLILKNQFALIVDECDEQEWAIGEQRRDRSGEIITKDISIVLSRVY